MYRFERSDREDTTLTDFMTVQRLRIEQQLSSMTARIARSRRERGVPALVEMDLERRMDAILNGGMGPRRPNLSQLDGDYE